MCADAEGTPRAPEAVTGEHTSEFDTKDLEKAVSEGGTRTPSLQSFLQRPNRLCNLYGIFYASFY